jgi:hypothetical protein
VGTTILGYPERDVWRMTPRKLSLLYIEHKKEQGQYQAPATIDDVIPF